MENKKYRLVEEDKLKRLIEGNMIYDELCAWGVDNWYGCIGDDFHFPEENEIEAELNRYDKIEERDSDD